MSELDYQAPAWLPGGHLQTIWAAKLSRPRGGGATTLSAGKLPLAFERQRWTTPDQDFIDVDVLPGANFGPLMVMFHGLEGSSQSHYAQSLGFWCRERGMTMALPHFRGCSGELNLAPRAYHSGDFEEVGWILQRLRAKFNGPMIALGVSLGGNALLRWVQESGHSAGRTLAAAAAVCSPLDLTAAGHHLGQGFNRMVYTRMFLQTLKPKAQAKLVQHPGLFDREAMLRSRTLYEFDNVVTGPLHGFAGTDDYWLRASSRPHLRQVRIPTLVVNTCNDPFVPASSLPTAEDVSDMVQLWQPAQGGHVGFASGAFPGHLQALPQTAAAWLLRQVQGHPWQVRQP